MHFRLHKLGLTVALLLVFLGLQTLEAAHVHAASDQAPHCLLCEIESSDSLLNSSPALPGDSRLSALIATTPEGLDTAQSIGYQARAPPQQLS